MKVSSNQYPRQSSKHWYTHELRTKKQWPFRTDTWINPELVNHQHESRSWGNIKLYNCIIQNEIQFYCYSITAPWCISSIIMKFFYDINHYLFYKIYTQLLRVYYISKRSHKHFWDVYCKYFLIDFLLYHLENILCMSFCPLTISALDYITLESIYTFVIMTFDTI